MGDNKLDPLRSAYMTPPPIPKYNPALEDAPRETANTVAASKNGTKGNVAFTAVQGALGSGGAPLNILPVKGTRAAILYLDNGSEYLPSLYARNLLDGLGVVDIGGPVFGAIAVMGIGEKDNILTGYFRFLASDFGYNGTKRLNGTSSDSWADLKTSGFNTTRNYTLGFSATAPKIGFISDLISSFGYAMEFNNNNYQQTVIVDENATPGVPDKDIQEAGNYHDVLNHVMLSRTIRDFTSSLYLTIPNKGKPRFGATFEYSGAKDVPVDLALTLAKDFVGASVGFHYFRFNGVVKHTRHDEAPAVTIQGQAGVSID